MSGKDPNETDFNSDFDFDFDFGVLVKSEVEDTGIEFGEGKMVETEVV